MSNLSQRFLMSAGRHFVTLSSVQHPPGTNEENVLVISGFLVDISGLWIYITAGHVLRDIRIAVEAGSQFDIWRLGDHRVIVKSGVQTVESSGGLIDRCHLDPIFKFNSSNDLGQVAESP